MERPFRQQIIVRMDRLIVTARLLPGTGEEARRLIELGPPYPVDRYQLRRHSVHVADGVVLFVFEGPDVEWVVEEMVNDPILAASFSAWAPLLEERPSIAREVFAWERE
jgi:hypothetical protein